MPVINGILYFRRQAIAWKYPELVHGKNKDYRIYNMDRNPKSKTYGQEKFDWYTDKYPKPTEEEMLSWHKQYKYLEERKYPPVTKQLEMLFDELKDTGTISTTGDWYKEVQAVKDEYPKGE